MSARFGVGRVPAHHLALCMTIPTSSSAGSSTRIMGIRRYHFTGIYPPLLRVTSKVGGSLYSGIIRLSLILYYNQKCMGTNSIQSCLVATAAERYPYIPNMHGAEDQRAIVLIIRLLLHADRGLLDPPTGEPAWHNSIGTTCYVVARPTSCMQRINEVFKPHIFLKRLLKRVFNGIKCGNDDVIRRAYIINTHFRISVLTIVIGLDYM